VTSHVGWKFENGIIFLIEGALQSHRVVDRITFTGGKRKVQVGYLGVRIRTQLLEFCTVILHVESEEILAHEERIGRLRHRLNFHRSLRRHRGDSRAGRLRRDSRAGRLRRDSRAGRLLSNRNFFDRFHHRLGDAALEQEHVLGVRLLAELLRLERLVLRRNGLLEGLVARLLLLLRLLDCRDALLLVLLRVSLLVVRAVSSVVSCSTVASMVRVFFAASSTVSLKVANSPSSLVDLS